MAALALPASIDWDVGPDAADIDVTTQPELSLITNQKAKYSNVSPVAGSFCYRLDTTAAAALSFERVDFLPILSTLWLGMYIRLRALPPVATYIMSWYNAAVKIGDLRLETDGSLSLRDSNSAVISSGASAALTVSSTLWDRIAIKIQPGSATGHQLKMYLGANRHGSTASYTSASAAATAAGQSALDGLRWGNALATVVQYDLDRMRLAATEPTGVPQANPTANAGSDQAGVVLGSTVQLTGAASGGSGAGYTYDWRLISGPASPSFSGIHAQNPTMTGFSAVGTYTVGLIVHDNLSATSTEDTMTITVIAAASDFTYLLGGAWRSASWQTLKNGVWS